MSRIRRLRIHSLLTKLQWCSMQLTQSLQKSLQDMMAPPVRSSTPTPLKNGVIWQRLRLRDEVRRSPPVYRVGAELFKERLDRVRLRDLETGVEYLFSTLRPIFVQDLQSVFLYGFFQMLRCNCGQTDYQRWMVRYEIARQKAVDAWVDVTTPRPIIGEAAVTAEVEQLRNAALDWLRAEPRSAWLGPPAGLQAHVDAIAQPEFSDAMRQLALRQCGEPRERARANQIPISDNLSALMALSWQTWVNLKERPSWTLSSSVTFSWQPWRSSSYMSSSSHCSTPRKSSLENPSWAHSPGPDRS